MPPGRTVRLDPWAAGYESALQLPEADEDAAARVDTTVETADWRPLRPPAGSPIPSIAFVDGVRRVEHRVLVESAQRTAFGLLGSFAVGATHVDGRARVVHERVERVACLGGGVRLGPLEAPIPASPQTIAFAPHSVPENTPVAPMQCLQTTMRKHEAELGDALAEAGTLVFLDGPLTFLAGSARPIVGFVKRLLKSYLPPGADAILRQLDVGERTPLFLIESRTSRYSWYVRLAWGRSIDSALAGVVRLEASGEHGGESARRLADASARELPRFASTPERDQRAPQNLYPIGGLEGVLQHLLGDHLVVRRAIEARLQREPWS